MDEAEDVLMGWGLSVAQGPGASAQCPSTGDIAILLSQSESDDWNIYTISSMQLPV